MKSIALLLLLFLGACTAQSDSSAESQKIKEILDVQASAWNEGNIEGFMQTYWQSDSLIFIGKSGLKYGWQTTLENYKKSYPDKAAMGKLNFEVLELKVLSERNAYLIGAWHLARSKDLGNLDAHSDLLLEKINGEWRIIADHSS